MGTEPASDAAASDTAEFIHAWLSEAEASHDLVANVERDPTQQRWYVRLRGEEKLVTTIWLTLRERTLSYEAYFMPTPEENVAQCYEYLLRANARLYGLRFSIGVEDAVYLVGQIDQSHVDADALDTIVGATYHYSEECFPTAMRIGFTSRFRREASSPT
jgi:hypothetical protein